MNSLIKGTIIKNINTVFIAVLVFFSFSTVVSAKTSSQVKGFDSTYTIDRFSTVINITKKNISISEDIKVNFSEDRHGIFRYIGEQYEYQSEDKKTTETSLLKVNVESVTDENGTPIKYQTYDEKDSISDEISIFNGLFHNSKIIKIGSDNVFVSGIQEYKIKYSISNFPESPSTFTFPLSGLGWSAEINNFQATIKFEDKPTDFKCIYGKYQSPTTTPCNINKITDNEYQVKQSLVEFNYGIQMNVKGINFIHDTSDAILFAQQYWYMGIPILVIILTFVLFITRKKEKGTGIITPQFSIPDDMRPGEAGTIIDDSMDRIDLSATIIDLAVRGYLKIINTGTEKKPKYQLQKLKEYDNNLKKYELTLLNSLFIDGNTMDIESTKGDTKMSDTYKKIQEQIYLWGISEGYYKSKPDKVNSIVYSIIIGAVVACIGYFLGLISIVVAIIIAIIVIPVTYLYFATREYKTAKGYLEMEKVQGLKLFIEYAKKDQLEMLQTPKQELFEKYLPYAMVFNQHKSWAKAFSELNLSSPSWYQGQGYDSFNTLNFVLYMNLFSNSVNTYFSIPFNETGVGMIGGVVGGAVGGGVSSGGGSW